MNRFFALLLAASCLTAVGQESYDIIGSSDSTFFLLSDHYLSWNEAKDVALTYDGHLATFTDLEENSVILAEVPTAPEGGYWFGLYQAGEGEEPGQGWGWVTGEALQFTRWAENEPNNVGNEDCGEIYGEGTWNDNACSIERRFIIEVPVSNFGCVNETACNYDAEAVIDDGSCLEFNDCGECGGSSITGCSDNQACNFNAEATCDDGSCDYSCCPGPGCCLDGQHWDWELNGCVITNPSDSNFDGCVQLNDLLDLLSAYGDCGAEESAWQCGDPLEYQGYEYETVQIGEQCWFAENLRAENYRNGDAITSGLSDQNWESISQGAQSIYGADGEACDHDSPLGDACDPSFSLESYGRIYNGWAVNDPRKVCPSGWYVPADVDWNELETFVGLGLGGLGVAYELKATSGWHLDGNGSNETGFSALPGGGRGNSGNYYSAGQFGFWWSSTQMTFPSNRYYRLQNSSNMLISSSIPLEDGISIRCIKDTE